MNTEAISIVKELRGTDCQCGATKTPGHSFCRACFLRLPVKLRERLYQKVGRGYEQAYADAIATLKGTQ